LLQQGEITDMRNLFDRIGGFQTGNIAQGFKLGIHFQRLKSVDVGRE